MFNADLELDGKKVRLLSFAYSMTREVDFAGKAAGDVRGGQLSLTIEATEDSWLFDWMIDPYALKSGKVIFYKPNEKATAKEVEFVDAYIIHRTESFADGSGTTIAFDLSAREIKIGGSTLSNEWPDFA